MRKIISILESEKYTSEAIQELQEILMYYLDKDERCMVFAAGESENSVWRLLKKLTAWYPGTAFGFCPSTTALLDKLIEEGRFETEGCGLLSFDIKLIGMDERLAKKIRDLYITKNADVVILPKSCMLELAAIKKDGIRAETILI